MKSISTWPALVCLAAVTFTPNSVHAHGFEGDRFFPPTLQTEDPFATDELSFTFQSFNTPASPGEGTPKTREIDINGEFDKEIFPKFALGVSGTYINLQPLDHSAPAQSGFDNVSLSAKYQLWEDAPHEWIFSVGAEVDLGDTGSHALGVDAFSTWTPTVYFGKGFGDLPAELKYLKPFALTGTVGLAVPGQSVNGDDSVNSDALEWGFALEYSLPYLQQHVQDIGLPKPLGDLIPLVEVSMDSPLDRSGATTTGTINPGILWEQRDFQIGAEAVIPVNSHTGPNVGAVVQVQIYIDDIFPKAFGHPIFGHDDSNDSGSR